jgi:hypothetical protein|tara:strand:- start:4469 stop:5545 length:1077 start_codon:yes stop_codon:yes gene_type:complete
MARNILKSNNAIVGVQNSTSAFFTSNIDLNLYNFVQSCDYSVSFSRQNTKQLGAKNYASTDIFSQPDVQLDLSYILEPELQNEYHGCFCQTSVHRFVPMFSGYLDANTNFYVLNAPNQEDDAIDSVNLGSTLDLVGWEGIAFGNCFPSSYNLSYSIGLFPTVSTSYICSNMKYEDLTGTSMQSPAINLESGNNNEVGLCVFNFDNGKTKPEIPNPSRPSSTVNLENLQVGGQRLSGTHFIQSVDMSVSLDRVSNYGLGSDFAYGRKALLPAQGTFSVSSLVSGFDDGQITGVLKNNSSYDFDLTLATSGDKKIIYQIEDAQLTSYNYSMPINGQMSFDAQFSFEVTDTKGLKISGSSY